MRQRQRAWTVVLVVNALLWVAFLQMSVTRERGGGVQSSQGPAMASSHSSLSAVATPAGPTTDASGALR